MANVAPLTADDIIALHEVYVPLTRSVRALIDAAIRTEADSDVALQAKADIDHATDLLRGRMTPTSFGVRHTADGCSIAWGNAAIGLRNPVAPPLLINRDKTGRAYADFELGAAYEGPAGHVHGGMCALILDHVLGATAHQPGSSAFTGTIELRYLRPTPLGALHVEASIQRVEGVKTYSAGYLADHEGPTVEAHGVFIRPLPNPEA